MKNQTHRPLLHDADPQKKIRELLAAREPFYRQADVLLNTELRSIREVAQQVVHQFRLEACRSAMKEKIRQRALELGFDDCRFTTADAPASAGQFQNWLAEKRHGGMVWLERTAAKRIDPHHVLPGARSVIRLAASYGQGDKWQGTSDMNRTPATSCHVSRVTCHAAIARYARFDDYHDILGERLKQLAAFVNQLGGADTRSLWYVDTGPLLERDFARRAGLGFIGKHTNLISRRFGNWILLGEIITTLELEPDAPEKNHCGNCARCLEMLPDARHHRAVSTRCAPVHFLSHHRVERFHPG